MRNYTPARKFVAPQGRKENFHYNLQVQKGHEIAFTLTLNPRIASRYTLTSFFFTATADICRKLKKSGRKFWIFPELTPMAGRLHWHGYIKIWDPIAWRFFVNYYNSMYGTMNTTDVKCYRSWMLYCSKEWLESVLMFKLYLRMKGDDGDEYINQNNWKRMLSILPTRKEKQATLENCKKSILDYGVYTKEHPEYEDLSELHEVPGAKL